MVFHIRLSILSNDGNLLKSEPNNLSFNCLCCVRYITLKLNDIVNAAYPINMGIICAMSQKFPRLIVINKLFPSNVNAQIESAVISGIRKVSREGIL
ncbi:MAG: hypothetical protein A3J73_04355 [Planctomycetes bacterium RIFCSPHIGHO2_02_FULL_38_41]|nr:MAG: hypothetical protein A3J73_04355 [Planctomycetes bacterium RIFCSPHIGHO2_02_FULL_38_41]